jgi:hypothetical protein
VVADGADESESLDDESVSLEDEPVSLEDEPEALDDESEPLEDVVVWAAVLCEVLAQARPLSASAAAAVSATAQRRSACMRCRPWSRARVG